MRANEKRIRAYMALHIERVALPRIWAFSSTLIRTVLLLSSFSAFRAHVTAANINFHLKILFGALSLRYSGLYLLYSGFLPPFLEKDYISPDFLRLPGPNLVEPSRVNSNVYDNMFDVCGVMCNLSFVMRMSVKRTVLCTACCARFCVLLRVLRFWWSDWQAPMHILYGQRFRSSLNCRRVICSCAGIAILLETHAPFHFDRVIMIIFSTTSPNDKTELNAIRFEFNSVCRHKKVIFSSHRDFTL